MSFNQWQHPVMIPPARRLTPSQIADLRRTRCGIPLAPVPSIAGQLAWLGLGYTIAGALFGIFLQVVMS